MFIQEGAKLTVEAIDKLAEDRVHASELAKQAAEQGVKIAVETVDEMIEEARPLFQEQWKEFAGYFPFPPDPDENLYREYNKAGILIVYTLRTLEGRMIGFASFGLRHSHPYYKTHGFALCDLLYVAQDYRRAGIGTVFIDFMERDLKARGAELIHIDVKVFQPALMFLLKNKAYKTTDCGMERLL
jgi:GNAT superfamily N-acetyltransferase